MKSHVHLQAALRREQLVAHVALVLLDAAVRFEMSGERALHRKRAETLAALVRLFVSVDPDVTNQVAWFLEFFAAIRALMPTHTIHLHIKIRCKTQNCAETSILNHPNNPHFFQAHVHGLLLVTFLTTCLFRTPGSASFVAGVGCLTSVSCDEAGRPLFSKAC